ncbi:MAG TPA: hypothetical protein VJP07_10660 [Dehalococcoidia bacterium]|nr:hypothetical protein [Dehalococcoidia bacterium]
MDEVEVRLEQTFHEARTHRERAEAFWRLWDREGRLSFSVDPDDPASVAELERQLDRETWDVNVAYERERDALSVLTAYRDSTRTRRETNRHG